MKKLLSLALALALLLTLSACNLFQKDKDKHDDTTTAAVTTTTTAVPIEDGPPAPMEPLQGGPMLYTFYGVEPYKMVIGKYDGEEYPLYPFGLVDQNGKLVSPAVYHKAEYIYDEAEQRVIGLAAVKDREFTIYQLDGTSRVLPINGFDIEVCPGGR